MTFIGRVTGAVKSGLGRQIGHSSWEAEGKTDTAEATGSASTCRNESGSKTRCTSRCCYESGNDERPSRLKSTRTADHTHRRRVKHTFRPSRSITGQHAIYHACCRGQMRHGRRLIKRANTGRSLKPVGIRVLNGFMQPQLFVCGQPSRSATTTTDDGTCGVPQETQPLAGSPVLHPMPTKSSATEYTAPPAPQHQDDTVIHRIWE